MTWTIKLSDTGGISFDANNRLVMIGEKNKESLDEVKQRTRIRFSTQRMSNRLHPYDGFDMFSLRKASQSVKNSGAPVSPEQLLEYEVMSTLSQDPYIDAQNSTLYVKNKGNREYEIHVSYGLKGSTNTATEFKGDLMI
jgi:hypothetical protein